MLILGLSSFKNDTAAALVRDGMVEAAFENAKLEPSITRGIPEAAIRFCLGKANCSWKDLDFVAVASHVSSGWIRRALSRPRLSVLAPVATAYQEGKEFGRLAWEWTALRSLRQRLNDPDKLVDLDHHSCHAASAYFLSPFEQALILTLDGEGDGAAGMLAVGSGNKIKIEKTFPFANSIGWIYSRLTDLIGFVPSKEEHKTQWLGLEGEPVYKEDLQRILRKPGNVFPHVDFRYFHRDITGVFEPSTYFFRQLGIAQRKSELTLEVRRNLAASVQAAITEVVSDLLTWYQKKTGFKQICLGGGVFHNTLLVAALEQKFGVGNVFVPPAPGNAGCSIGAALWVWHQRIGKLRDTHSEPRSVYWGPSYARTEVKEVLDNAKARYALQNTGEKKLDSAVSLLRAGKIVGWFHGATEFGPRALGHRSLLASPWAPYVTENLNDFVKHRESFRPFAVSVREEDCARYFNGSPLCRMMNSLASIRPDADVLPRSLQLPGGLVRLHIVEKETDALLWELLRRFGEQEPAPILVNTSFNLPGEPPVIRPKDAVRTFFCSGIDAVFVDNFLLTKSSSAHILNARPGILKPEVSATVL
ncbi:MAG TPA: carbamoyltransferase C-terminal domain-containing protein [Verrucomicrobiae bacterium]|jgi:carbamoyltransferase|nr:carbamoyltransferase C-terminal domain-containing protein [Verrucomicrobiae bacterium]